MISILTGIYIGGVIVTAFRYIEDWDVWRRAHIIEAILVSLLWFIFIPLNVLDSLRRK